MPSEIELLEEWRERAGKACTWSIGGPNKGFVRDKYSVTLYQFHSPTFRNEAYGASKTLQNAVEKAIALWDKRVAEGVIK